MNFNPTHGATTLWQKLIMPEETRRLYPSAPLWDGGYRWFRSGNVVDLQDYRSSADKERIRRVLLNRHSLRSDRPL
jgi:hypothetical protein